MDQPTLTLTERAVALLEVIAYQTSGRVLEIGPYLTAVYSRYRERNPEEHAPSREERA